MAIARGRLVGATAAGIGVAGAAVLWRQMAPARRQGGPIEERAEPQVWSRLASWVPPRPTTRAGRVAAAAWASPLTAVGLMLAVLSQPDGWHKVDGALVVTGAGGPLGAILARRGFAGTTLGHCVVLTPSAPSPALVNHELVHVRQAERLGLAFGPVYVGLLARYGYRDHPMERAARLGATRGGEAVGGSRTRRSGG